MKTHNNHISKTQNPHTKLADHTLPTSLFFRGITLHTLQKIFTELPKSPITTDIQMDLMTLHKQLGHPQELNTARDLQSDLIQLEAKIKEGEIENTRHFEATTPLSELIDFAKSKISMLYPENLKEYTTLIVVSSGHCIDVKEFYTALMAQVAEKVKIKGTSLHYIPTLNNPHTNKSYSFRDMMSLLAAIKKLRLDYSRVEPILLNSDKGTPIFIGDKETRAHLFKRAKQQQNQSLLDFCKTSILHLENVGHYNDLLITDYHVTSSILCDFLTYPEKLDKFIKNKEDISPFVHSFITANLLNKNEACMLDIEAIKQCEDRLTHLRDIIRNELIEELVSIQEEKQAELRKGKSRIEISILRIYETLYNILCKHYGVNKMKMPFISLDEEEEVSLDYLLADCIKSFKHFKKESINFYRIKDIIEGKYPDKHFIKKPFYTLSKALEEHCIQSFLTRHDFLIYVPFMVTVVLNSYRKTWEDLPYHLRNFEENFQTISQGCQLALELKECKNYQLPFEMIFSMTEDHFETLNNLINELEKFYEDQEIKAFLVHNKCPSSTEFLNKIFAEDSSEEILNKLLSRNFLANLESSTVREHVLSNSITFKKAMCFFDSERKELKIKKKALQKQNGKSQALTQKPSLEEGNSAFFSTCPSRYHTDIGASQSKKPPKIIHTHTYNDGSTTETTLTINTRNTRRF